VKKGEQVFAEKDHVILTSMTQHRKEYAIVRQRIAALTKQYEEALKKGAEFSTLKKIRDELKELKKSIQNNDDKKQQE
jgi:protein-arginine kinase activator protein McsA